MISASTSRRSNEQHKKLVGFINELHDSFKSGRGNEVIGKILDGLVNYTKVHFSTEEKLMEKYLYPGYVRHKNEHDDLVKQVNDLQGKIKSGGMVVSLEVMQFLKNWLNNHILKSDKLYGPFLNKKGIS